jgi:hypothetical protein
MNQKPYHLFRIHPSRNCNFKLSRDELTVNNEFELDPYSTIQGGLLVNGTEKVNSKEVYDSANRLESDLVAIKSRLYSLCAMTDRGFGAEKKDRDAIENLIDRLQSICDPNPTRGLICDIGYDASKYNEPGMRHSPIPYTYFPFKMSSNKGVPIEGVWRLIYTTALDVLSLGINPIAQLQGIYQVQM